MYRKIKIGKNDICLKCREENKKESSNLSTPLSYWIVGEKFHEDPHKILFVGKTARGNEEEIGAVIDGLFRDGTQTGEELFREKGWAYWKYTRDIVLKNYENVDDPLKHIAFTNLIKCNNSDTVDRTLFSTKHFCLDELQVFWKELEIIDPKKVIFYTGWEYDNFISDHLCNLRLNFEDITNRYYKVEIGKKQMPWWHRIIYDDGSNEKWEFLRIGHPERMKEEDYVNKVYEWIKNGTNPSSG